MHIRDDNYYDNTTITHRVILLAKTETRMSTGTAAPPGISLLAFERKQTIRIDEMPVSGLQTLKTRTMLFTDVKIRFVVGH